MIRLLLRVIEEILPWGKSFMAAPHESPFTAIYWLCVKRRRHFLLYVLRSLMTCSSFSSNSWIFPSNFLLQTYSTCRLSETNPNIPLATLTAIMKAFESCLNGKFMMIDKFVHTLGDSSSSFCLRTAFGHICTDRLTIYVVSWISNTNAVMPR